MSFKLEKIYNDKTGLVSAFFEKTAEEIIETALTKIATDEKQCTKTGGNAFGRNGVFLLYSGPAKKWIKAWENHAITSAIKNKTRTQQRVDLSKCEETWLEGSSVGQWLDDNKLYECFLRKNGGRTDGYYNDVDLVMSVVSKKYVRAAFGHVATNVCGANHTRIFYQAELKEVVHNKRVLTINDLPRLVVKAFYDINPDEAFQLICWAEIVKAKKMIEANPTDAALQEDYKQRLFFFEKERAHTANNVLNLSPLRQWQRRQKRMNIFMVCGKGLLMKKMRGLLGEVYKLKLPEISLSLVSAKASRFLNPDA